MPIPRDWKDAVIGVGYFYKFPPSEIWEMTIDELLFWAKNIKRIDKWLM